MHDPYIEAFRIGNIITVWHVDPETDGTDDSCDWFYRNLTEQENKAALDILHDPHDNMMTYVKSMDIRDADFLMQVQWRIARKFYAPRKWWQHPRWHIWHWEIQVNPLLDVKRWLFSRCAVCGKRFPYGYAPISNGNDNGPHWFKSESGVMHHKCADTLYK